MLPLADYSPYVCESHRQFNHYKSSMRHASPSPAQSTDSVVAVFDFDGTLTRRDSLLPFLHRAVGRFRFLWGMLVLTPMLLRYALRLIVSKSIGKYCIAMDCVSALPFIFGLVFCTPRTNYAPPYPVKPKLRRSTFLMQSDHLCNHPCPFRLIVMVTGQLCP